MFLITRSSRSLSETPRACAHCFSALPLRDGFPEHTVCLGNFSQNSGGAADRYSALTGMSGNFGLNFFIAGSATPPAATTARIRLIHPQRAASASGLKPAQATLYPVILYIFYSGTKPELAGQPGSVSCIRFRSPTHSWHLLSVSDTILVCLRTVPRMHVISSSYGLLNLRKSPFIIP
jgi:hypothetical protein